MNNICLVRLYGKPGKAKDLVELMKGCGCNTGNMVWYEAVRKSIIFQEELEWRDEVSYREIRDKYRDLVFAIPMANHICVGNTVLEHEADCLSTKSNDRVVIMGLGAQLTKELNTPKKLMSALPRERINAIKRLAEHSVSVGVRGAITAECLDYIGVHNHRIIGCPSFYSNKNAVMSVCEKRFDGNGRISLNISAYGTTGIAAFLNLVKNAGLFHDSQYILQDMLDFPKTIYENLPITKRHMRERFPGFNMSAEEFTDYVKRQGAIFKDTDSWSSFFTKAQIHLSVGARFHGNMIALLSGVPAIWLVHDSRTTELCECMNLPHIEIEKVTRIKEFNELLEIQNYGSDFKKQYENNFDVYMSFLKENELQYNKFVV